MRVSRLCAGRWLILEGSALKAGTCTTVSLSRPQVTALDYVCERRGSVSVDRMCVPSQLR
jgi:hypothetical protein